LSDAVRGLAAAESIRCVVLRGAGDQSFSVGADTAEISATRSNSKQARSYAFLVREALQALAACRHPTLALIQGTCEAEALALAAVCDMRICSASSTFALPAARLGATLDVAELAAVLAIAGRAATLEMLLEGRVLSAPEAYSRRVVNRVVADPEIEQAGQATAGLIASGAPLAARWNKQFVSRLSIAGQLDDVDVAETFACFDSEDYRIGVDAAVRNSTPRFNGR
jgi:enoyl-CoA hydratase